MTRGTALLVGVSVGVLAAMIVTAIAVPMLPGYVRGATALWATAAAVVALTVWVFWAMSAPRDR